MECDKNFDGFAMGVPPLRNVLLVLPNDPELLAQLRCKIYPSQKPVSVGYSIDDATSDAMKAHDAFIDALRFQATPNESRRAIVALGSGQIALRNAIIDHRKNAMAPQVTEKPKKNALRFLDGLGYRKRKMR